MSSRLIHPRYEVVVATLKVDPLGAAKVNRRSHFFSQTGEVRADGVVGAFDKGCVRFDVAL